MSDGQKAWWDNPNVGPELRRTYMEFDSLGEATVRAQAQTFAGGRRGQAFHWLAGVERERQDEERAFKLREIDAAERSAGAAEAAAKSAKTSAAEARRARKIAQGALIAAAFAAGAAIAQLLATLGHQA